jgi:hypothetical protein
MFSVLDLREKYRNLNSEIFAKQEEQEYILKTLREKCSHTFVLEKDYGPETTFSDAKPPARACEVCNYSEGGWGTGYKKLRDSPERIVQKVSEDEFHKDHILNPIHNIELFVR